MTCRKCYQNISRILLIPQIDILVNYTARIERILMSIYFCESEIPCDYFKLIRLSTSL